MPAGLAGMQRLRPLEAADGGAVIGCYYYRQQENLPYIIY